MPEEKKEEKPSFLKKIFRGNTLDGSIEAARSKTLTETNDLEEKRKNLLKRLDKAIGDKK